MMTLEEAIEQYANTAVFCKMHESEKYAAEFKQLAAWLRELAERRKAQLSQEGTTSDTISRQQAIDEIKSVYEWHDTVTMERLIEHVNNLPTIQTVATDTNVGDKISKFIDGLEVIFADLRERHVDDSVCGLCEYDGAYVGASGDWCNECPGFDRDDCFKLSDETRRKWTEQITKSLPSVQPEIIRCGECGHRDPEDKKCDCGHDIIWQLPRNDDWFCADAERRTDK